MRLQKISKHFFNSTNISLCFRDKVDLLVSLEGNLPTQTDFITSTLQSFSSLSDDIDRRH